MRRLALSDEILLAIDKPVRYIGNEVNMAVKDPAAARIRFAMCFPDVYEIGMSHLGIQLLYEQLNRRADTYCERVFSPWLDLDKIMRERSIPLFALESQDPVREFDFLGITLQYEMCYTNVLQVLELSQIPLHAADRGDGDPIVIGGGPCTYNPEPLAEFFDLFYIGEGEVTLDALMDLYLECKAPGGAVGADGQVTSGQGMSGQGAPDKRGTAMGAGALPISEQGSQVMRRAAVGAHGTSGARPDGGGGSGGMSAGILPLGGSMGAHPDGGGGFRREFLRRAAQVPGIYVPAFYEATYHEDGRLSAFAPLADGVPATVVRQLAPDLDATVYIEKPIVPFLKVTQDRVVVEIQRGCIRGCRFCQAGMVYRPLREHSLGYLERVARRLLEESGHEEISLSSLSSSDYTYLEELVTYLVGFCSGRGVNISLPSLRIDAFSLGVMGKVQDVRKSSLTFAPEAGTQRLRDVINKGLTEDAILDGAAKAFAAGWSKVKLYFMLGLPTETDEDVEAIAALSDKIADVYARPSAYGFGSGQVGAESVGKGAGSDAATSAGSDAARSAGGNASRSAGGNASNGAPPKRAGRVSVTASSSFFVPKPFTPFQWVPMCSQEEFIRRANVAREAFRRMPHSRSLRYNWHEAHLSVLEGAMARGDRRLGRVIETAYRAGALYDSWADFFKPEVWVKAFADCGLDMGFYYARERGKDELLPWDFIDCGVGKGFLWKEWERARRGEVTPNCREKCSGCGGAVYGCGVCRDAR
ncbi:MAG: radical SAM protein [Lachnospiraceae bacterium]|nr:radical SAM protein [Lachnospiraceae bacterium]